MWGISFPFYFLQAGTPPGRAHISATDSSGGALFIGPPDDGARAAVILVWVASVGSKLVLWSSEPRWLGQSTPTMRKNRSGGIFG